MDLSNKLTLSCNLQVMILEREAETCKIASTCTTATQIEEKLEQGQKQKRSEETNSKMLLF